MRHLYIYTNEHLAKTGSGQTQGKLQKRGALYLHRQVQRFEDRQQELWVQALRLRHLQTEAVIVLF